MYGGMMGMAPSLTGLAAPAPMNTGMGGNMGMVGMGAMGMGMGMGAMMGGHMPQQGQPQPQQDWSQQQALAVGSAQPQVWSVPPLSLVSFSLSLSACVSIFLFQQGSLSSTVCMVSSLRFRSLSLYCG